MGFELSILYFMTFLAITLSFLAFYLDNPAILGFAGVFFLMIGGGLLLYEPTKVLVVGNVTQEVAVSWPWKNYAAIMFILFGILELYSTYFSTKQGV